MSVSSFQSLEATSCTVAFMFYAHTDFMFYAQLLLSECTLTVLRRVWSKLIEALADIGYMPSELHMASYDWRLPYKVAPEPLP